MTTYFNGKTSVISIPAYISKITFDFSSVTSDTVAVTERSLYWHHLAIGVPAGSGTHCQLNGLDYPAALIMTTTTNMPDDSLTADTLQWMTPNAPV